MTFSVVHSSSPRRRFQISPLWRELTKAPFLVAENAVTVQTVGQTGAKKKKPFQIYPDYRVRGLKSPNVYIDLYRVFKQIIFLFLPCVTKSNTCNNDYNFIKCPDQVRFQVYNITQAYLLKGELAVLITAWMSHMTIW